jgi:DNA replication protein DnaC
LKAIINEPEYAEMLAALQKVDVLYIDDFFKPMKDDRGKDLPPTKADIRLAYEILDYRYQHRDLITIISSERHVHELEEIDSAVGSRIYEMTKQNAYNIAKTKDRNYRLRDMVVI